MADAGYRHEFGFVGQPLAFKIAYQAVPERFVKRVKRVLAIPGGKFPFGAVPLGDQLVVGISLVCFRRGNSEGGGSRSLAEFLGAELGDGEEQRQVQHPFHVDRPAHGAVEQKLDAKSPSKPDADACGRQATGNFLDILLISERWRWVLNLAYVGHPTRAQSLVDPRLLQAGGILSV